MSATVVTSENLAEFNASKMGISFAPEPAAAAEPAEPAGEVTTPEETPSEVEGEATQQEDQKSEKSKIDKRFGELTKQREDAKRDAAREREAREALEAKLKDLEAKVNPPKEEKTDEKPQPGQFTDAYEYAEALAEWSAENALKARDKKNAEQQEAIERNKVVKAWTERQNAAKVAMPDYEETLSASTVEVSDFVKQAIVESEVGPQLLSTLPRIQRSPKGLPKNLQHQPCEKSDGWKPHCPATKSQLLKRLLKPLARPQNQSAQSERRRLWIHPSIQRVNFTAPMRNGRPPGKPARLSDGA